jgi:hypothetical protein
VSFFGDIDDLKVVERHIQDVQKLEEKSADKLIATYKRIRNELRDRLDRLPEGTFTAQQIRGVLIQIEAALLAMEENLRKDMAVQAMLMAEKGIKDLAQEISVFSKKFEGAVIPINIDAVSIALDTRNFLINKYEVSLAAYREEVRQRLTTGLLEKVIAETPTGVIIQKLSKFFTAEEWRLRRIVRTELHHVYNLGKINGMKDVKEMYIPNLKKTLVHPMDSRTANDSKQAALQDLVVEIDKPFRYTYTRRLKDGTIKKELREFMSPPDRPNDRSILVPYRGQWDK